MATVTCLTPYDLDSAAAVVAELGPAPHILALAGAAGGSSRAVDEAMAALTRQFNTLLANGDRYFPFGVVTHPAPRLCGVWLSERHVPPLAHHPLRRAYQPPPVMLAPDTLSVVVAGARVAVLAVDCHHSHVLGSPRPSIVDRGLAAMPAVVAGCFITTASADQQPRRAGFSGFWEAARSVRGDARVLVSYETQAVLLTATAVTGSSAVGVACELEFSPADPGFARPLT